MKKIALFGLALAALTMASCNKEAGVEAPKATKTVSIAAVLDETTKTVADAAGKTEWAEKDSLSVFVALEQETDYSSNYRFELAEGSSSVFTGEVELEDGESYDWYAIYPYTKQIETPGVKTQGFVRIGPSPQTQAAANDMSHVAGKNVPLVGVAKSVMSDEMPEIKMYQASSLLQFDITNPEGNADIKIASIQFVTKSTKISGTWYVDFTESTPVYTSSGDKYTYNDVTLKVTDGTIAAGETGSFYATVCPVVLPANETNTIIVTLADGSVCTKEWAPASATTLQNGHVKNLKFDFVKDQTKEATVSEIVALMARKEDSYTGYVMTGVVSAISATAYDNISQGTIVLTDNTTAKNSAITIYTGTSATGLAKSKDVKVGDKIKINLANAKLGENGGAPQLTGVDATDLIETISSNNTLVYTKVTIAEYNANALDYNNMLLEFVNVKPAEASVGQTPTKALTFTDGTDNLTVYNRSSWTAGAALKIGDKTGTLHAKASYYNAAQVTPINATDYNPFIADEEEVAAGTYELTFPKYNDKKVGGYETEWTATVDGNTWSIVNFNNNNNGWAFIKCGSKSKALVSTITSPMLAEAIKTMTVTYNELNAAEVNSIKVEVATDSEFANIVETINDSAPAAGAKTYTVTTPGTNRYYRLVIDCQKAASNGPVVISKIVYSAN